MKIGCGSLREIKTRTKNHINWKIYVCVIYGGVLMKFFYNVAALFDESKEKLCDKHLLQGFSFCWICSLAFFVAFNRKIYLNFSLFCHFSD